MASRTLEHALRKVRAARRLRNELSSEELGQIRKGILQRSVFSAKVTKAKFLDGIKDVTEKVLRKEINPLDAREALKEIATRGGYRAPKGLKGTIQDLTSNQRLDLIVRTNRDMARGFGRFVDAQKSLDKFPWWELYRAEPRAEPRNWSLRWGAAGGGRRGGKMVAQINDPIWSRISAFSLPYPPFDYNSGMSIRRVSVESGAKLGMKKPKDQKPKRIPDFGDSESEIPKDTKLAKQLLKDLGEGYEINGTRVVRSR